MQSLGSVVDTNLVVSGNVVSSQAITNQIVAGLQMLAYPFSTSVDLNETQLKDNATGAFIYGSADRVIVWDVASQNYATYALYDDGGTREWRNKLTFYVSAGSIDMNLGAGFWYDAQNGFSWAETNKYYSSL